MPLVIRDEGQPELLRDFLYLLGCGKVALVGEDENSRIFQLLLPLSFAIHLYRVEEHAVELELGQVGVGLVGAVHNEYYCLCIESFRSWLACVFA